MESAPKATRRPKTRVFIKFQDIQDSFPIASETAPHWVLPAPPTICREPLPGIVALVDDSEPLTEIDVPESPPGQEPS